jgi:hypothetical protein
MKRYIAAFAVLGLCALLVGRAYRTSRDVVPLFVGVVLALGVHAVGGLPERYPAGQPACTPIHLEAAAPVPPVPRA